MVMNNIICCNGGTTYKLPHAGKDAIIRSQKQDTPLRLPCQAMYTGGVIGGNVIKAYMEGGLAALNQVAPAPHFMVSGQILTNLVVPASFSAVILPTRLGGANALDLLNEAIGIRGDDRMDLTDAAPAVELEDFWDDFEERIEWGGQNMTMITSQRQQHNLVSIN